MEIERRLVLEVVRVTEQAALAASRLAGKGDKEAVDEAGTEAMRRVLNELPIKGTVVIGEGEMDEAPMLYIGEVLGAGGLEVDIAVDPVEGTTTAAKGLPNAVTVIAISEKGGLFHAPDMYMEKLIVPPPAAGLVDLTWPVAANLKALALALQRSVEDLVVVVLDRPRHEGLIREIREAGARVKLISDGDVIAALAAAIRGTGVHASWASAGPRKGFWRRRPSSAWAGRSRPASPRKTRRSGPASRPWAGTRTASTAPRTWPRERRSSSPPPA